MKKVTVTPVECKSYRNHLIVKLRSNYMMSLYRMMVGIPVVSMKASGNRQRALHECILLWMVSIKQEIIKNKNPPE